MTLRNVTLVRTMLLGALLLAGAPPSLASAAPAWVERGTNLPRHDGSFDVGLGIAHRDFGPDDVTGTGLNLEGAVGVTEGFEIGVRTGFRFGNGGEATHADEYGRLFDRQTFGTFEDPVADPEVRFRGRVVHTRIVDLALEGRASLPIEDRSRFGLMFDVPLVIRLGGVVRGDDVTDVSAGFGLGYQFTHFFDLKTMLLFPGINHEAGAKNVGAGVGVELRIE